MGQKNKSVNYDTKALQNLANQIYRSRQPIGCGELPKINVDLEALQESLYKLPKKEREILERFWGLIPGTRNYSSFFYSKMWKANDIAYNNMRKNALDIVNKKLVSIEFLYSYDKNVQDLIERIMSKINKDGAEHISDIDVIKYFIIFLVFILEGPNLTLQFTDEKATEFQKEHAKIDEYAILQGVWEDSMKVLKERSINFKLLLECISMFDVKDVIAMKRFVGLPLSKEEESTETDKLSTIRDIRLFKEKIFPYGAWEAAIHFIYYNGSYPVDLTEFWEKIVFLRSDWKKISEFEKEIIDITTSTETRKVQVYDIAEIEFTDIYEVMFLYVSRNVL